MKRNLLCLFAVLLFACSTNEKDPSNNEPGSNNQGSNNQGSNNQGSNNQGSANNEPDPGTVTQPEDLPAEYVELLQTLAVSQAWTTQEFLDAYTPPFATSLPYDPADAMFLDLVQGSSFALDAAENDRLGRDGFVITDEQFPSFVYGYGTIYMEDLPVYVSADSILHAVHRSYDSILTRLEEGQLITALSELIRSMRARLEAGAVADFGTEIERDLDLQLAVGLTLLEGTTAVPVAGGDAARIHAYVQKAIAATGTSEVLIFGGTRQLDFSQFEPRGHYTLNENLERYFRAMIWFGRIDFRILEPDSSNQLVFSRRQFDLTLATDVLVEGDGRDRFELIDSTIGAFIGEPDGLHLSQMTSLLDALGVEEPAETATLDDAFISATIQKHRFGTQRISSHFMVNGIRGTTKPLAHSFALLGQRYVIDSHVFSNVVYDRVQGGAQYRMMPDPLDVAFAALANDQAAQLLAPQLGEYNYQHDLRSMRVLADAHGADFWSANLYNHWMSALRALSPDDFSALPTVAQTEPWGRRILNTQLASWAELRHDTILYTKQSYTAGAACEYPDAYIDPYPAVFEALSAFAAKGHEIAANLGEAQVQEYFVRLQAATDRLARMADRQRSGEPHDAEDIAWINEAVVQNENCDGTLLGAEGWYSELFFSVDEMDFDPTIADVHTQPTDASGAPVGKVLHVGTGMPRAIVVTVDTCEGPRAYVGLTSAYHERVTENFERLTDEEWAPDVMAGTVDTPAWLSPVLP